MRSNQVEGTIICPAGSTRDSEALVEAYGDPIVVVDNADQDGAADSVTLDNREAGLITARHLTEFGQSRWVS
jgi:DNA-binding LacI/PurR family transcriptional regulator